MYTSLYHLQKKPFEVLPDPDFLWLGPKQQEAYTLLRYGVMENKGFLLLLGEAGCGKTTMINGLTRDFDETVLWAVIDDPRQERIDFYNTIAAGFGLQQEFGSKVQFLLQFSQFLHRAHDEGKRVLLVVDDCHLLSQEMLEELRLLSNIERADVKLINILFAGQKEFGEILVQPKNRAVRQRLTLKTEVGRLTQEEVAGYIGHRLKVAGTTEKIFTGKATHLIHQYSQGVPRRINLICDHSLVAASVQGKGSVDHKVVEGCLRKLNLPINPTQADFASLENGAGNYELFRQSYTAHGPGGSSVTGFNLENDSASRWLKVGTLAGLLAVAGGGWFYYEQYFGQEQPAPLTAKQVVAPATLESPALAVLGEQQGELAEDRSVELKASILKNAYQGKEAVSPLAAQELKSPAVLPEDQSVAAEARTSSQPTITTTTSGTSAGSERKGSIAATAGKTQVVEPVQAASEELNGGAPVPEVLETAAGPGRELAPEAAVAGGGLEQQVPAQIQERVASPPEVEEPAVPAQPPMSPASVRLPLQANSLKLTREGQQELSAFLQVLKEYPAARLMIKGYVSAKTNSEENIELSRQRAKMVEKLLVEKGVDREMLEVKAMGNTEPLASNASAKGRNLNRRVEIVVVDDGREVSAQP